MCSLKFRKIHWKTPALGWRPATLLKRDSSRCFLMNFAKILRTYQQTADSDIRNISGTSRYTFPEHPCMASYVG